MAKAKGPERRWLLPVCGFVIAGAGGGIGALLGPQWAGAGGVIGGVAGLTAGLALTMAVDRRLAAAARAQAIERRAAAGEVLPIPVTNPRGEPKPSWLLSPDNQIAQFRGRRQLLTDLQTWLSDAGGPPVLVMAGPAGAGKTRLTVRLAEELGAQ